MINNKLVHFNIGAIGARTESHRLIRMILFLALLFLLITAAGARATTIEFETATIIFVKKASPKDGTDFIFDMSGPANPNTPTFLAEWGSQGSNDGEFSAPRGVTADAAGNVFVADTGNNRIQKFDKDGDFITEFGRGGNEADELFSPTNLATDAANNVFVVDRGIHRVQMYDNDGTFISKFGGQGTDDGKFDLPRGIALDKAGNIFVADTGNNRIQKFDKNGTFLGKWGSEGSDNGDFDSPRGLATDAAGNVYVTDTNNHRIQKFDNNGNFIGKWGSQGSTDGKFDSPRGVATDAAGNVYVADTNNHRIQKFDNNGTFLSKWGEEGGIPGFFQGTADVALGPGGNVYAADLANSRIQKFLASTFVLDDADPDDGDTIGDSVTFDDVPIGAYEVTEQVPNGWTLSDVTCVGDNAATVDLDKGTVTFTLIPDELMTCTFTNKGPGSLTFIKSASPRDGTDFIFDLSGPANPTTPTFLGKLGTLGSGDGQFIEPVDVALDAVGDVYVVDSGNHRIQKFDKNGVFLSQFGSQGSDDGQFNFPFGVAVDQVGNIYIADRNNHRIQKFDKNGVFLSQFGSQGSDDGQFNFPFGVAVDQVGNIYVVDSGNHRIQKFDKNGVFLSQFGSQGSNDGQFDGPFGVTVDQVDNIYVTDLNNHRIQKFDKDGAFLTKWGSEGSGDSQFIQPLGVAVDQVGNIYVADRINHRIQKFDKDGAFLTKWGSKGSGDSQFIQPFGVAVDQVGNIYVTDRINHRIQKFLASTFVLDDANPDDGDPIGSSITYNNLPIGKYQATEQTLAGWDLSSLICEGDSASQVNVDLAKRSVSIDLVEDEHVSCTFTNHMPVPQLTATKSDESILDNNGDGTADPGDTVRYSVFIQNNGDDAALSVLFADTVDSNSTPRCALPATPTTTQGSITGCTAVAGGQVSADIGTLSANGGSATVTFEVTLNTGLPDSVREICNQGLVTAENHEDVKTDDPDTAKSAGATCTSLVDEYVVYLPVVIAP